MTLIDNKSLFGKDFKYILVLGLLAWMTYSLPSVQAALQTADSDVSSDTAAVITAQVMPMMATGQIPLKASLENRRRLSPQEVVTLLYGLGIIAPDKLDLARKAVADTDQGSTTPEKPCVPPNASSTPGQTPPCRPLIRAGAVTAPNSAPLRNTMMPRILKQPVPTTQQ